MYQKTEKIQGNGEAKSTITEYAYDVDENLIKIKSPRGAEIRREYDADEKHAQERVIDKRNDIDRKMQYAYNEADNMVKLSHSAQTVNTPELISAMTIRIVLCTKKRQM